MKLSTFTAKLTCIKSKAVRVLTVATLAGAVLTAVAVTPAAQAQQFGFGISVGGPAYSGYYDRLRSEQWREHERHEAWERQQAFERREAFERQQAWNREHAFRHDFDDHRFHDRDDHRDFDHRDRY